MRRRGFTLIEVLVALFLVAICIALMVQVLPLTREADRKAEEQAKVVFATQKLMEELLVMPPDSWPEETMSGGAFFRVVREDYSAQLIRLRIEAVRKKRLDDEEEEGLTVYRLETLVFR